MGRQVIADAITEWWVGPTATALTGPDRTVLGAISASGQVLACQMDHDAGTTSRVVVGQVQPDDHNAPALWAQAGHRSLIVWTRHGVDTLLRLRVSTAPGQVDAWGPEVTVDLGGAVSYAQVHRIAHLSTSTTGTFWIFTRVTGLTWRMVPVTVDQTDGAVGVGAAVQILTAAEQTYISTADAHTGTGQVIRLAWGYNPAASADDVRYVEIDAATGAVTSPVDPSVAANIAGAGLPLVDSAIAPVLPSMPVGFSRRLFYVRPGPAAPAVAIAEWATAAPDDATYHVVRLDGSRTSYGTSGPRVGYIAGANYIAGMAFPDPCPDARVAVARVSSGVSTVELVTPAGTSVLGQSSDARLIRPTMPRGRTDRVLCSHVTSYAPDTYTEYASDVVALWDDPGGALAVVEDQRVTVFAGELRTGRVLVHDLPVTDASWEQVHRDAGSVRATIPLYAVDPDDRAALLSYLHGPRAMLGARRGSQVLQAGPVWMHDYDGAGSLQVAATGLLGLWDRRVVWRTPQTPDPRRNVTRWWGVELGTIVVRLIKQSLSQRGGDVPVVLPPERSGAHERTYEGYELPGLGDAIRDLMDVQGGPDVALEPRLTPDGTHVEWVLRVGRDAAPMLSQPGDDWVWDTSVVRSSVSGMRVRRDWSGMVTRQWATGEGQEYATMMAAAVDSSAHDAGYPLLDGVSAHPTVSRQSTLAAHAAGGLAARRRGQQTWSITLTGDPQVARCRPGDWGRLWLPPDDPYLGHLTASQPSYRTRIVRLAGDLTDTTTIDLAPTMDGW